MIDFATNLALRFASWLALGVAGVFAYLLGVGVLWAVSGGRIRDVMFYDPPLEFWKSGGAFYRHGEIRYVRSWVSTLVGIGALGGITASVAFLWG